MRRASDNKIKTAIEAMLIANQSLEYLIAGCSDRCQELLRAKKRAGAELDPSVR